MSEKKTKTQSLQSVEADRYQKHRSIQKWKYKRHKKGNINRTTDTQGNTGNINDIQGIFTKWKWVRGEHKTRVKPIKVGQTVSKKKKKKSKDKVRGDIMTGYEKGYHERLSSSQAEMDPGLSKKSWILLHAKHFIKWLLVHFSVSTFLESGLKMGHSGNGYKKKMPPPCMMKMIARGTCRSSFYVLGTHFLLYLHCF